MNFRRSSTGNEAIDRHRFLSSASSNLGLNHVRGSGLVNPNLGLNHVRDGGLGLNHVRGSGLVNPNLGLSNVRDGGLGLNHVRDGGLVNSNLGLNYVRDGGLGLNLVREVNTTYVSPNRVEVHTTIDYAPQSAFPLSDVTSVTEVVRTTRFLTATSTLERMFVPRASEHGVFATNQPDLFMNVNPSPFHFENPSQDYQQALNRSNQITTVHNNVNRDIVFHENPTSTTVHNNVNRDIVFHQNPTSTAVHDNVNRDIVFHENPTSNQGHLSGLAQTPVVLPNPENQQVTNQPSLHSSSEEVSVETEKDDDDNDLSGYDGRTHSLPGYPEGVFACPKCLATFGSSQLFAAHIQGHYRNETEKERKRRMAAKCRRRNHRLMQSPHGLTAIAQSSRGIVKGNTARRGTEISVRGDEVNSAPLEAVAVKEEPK